MVIQRERARIGENEKIYIYLIEDFLKRTPASYSLQAKSLRDSVGPQVKNNYTFFNG